MKKRIDIWDILADGLRRGFWAAVFLAAFFLAITGAVHVG